MMAYYHTKYKEETILVKHSIIGVSDDPKKDSFAVKHYEDIVFDIIESDIGPLKMVNEFTDGCSSQY